MWKNMAKADRPQVITQGFAQKMQIACRIIKERIQTLSFFLSFLLQAAESSLRIFTT
jgi:hypothetical protein